MLVPTTGLLVGKARAELGQLLAARKVLIRVISHRTLPNEPKPFVKARRVAAILKQQIEQRLARLRITVAPKKGTWPADVDWEAKLDGRRLTSSQAARRRSLDPGKYTVCGQAAGYVQRCENIELQEGEDRVLRIVLPSATPAQPLPLPTGSVNQKADGSPPGTLSVAITGYGLAVVGAVAGTITGALALSAASNAQQGCVERVCPTENEEYAFRSNRLADASTASFVVAGIGAAVGTAALLWWLIERPDERTSGPEQDQAQLSVRPVIGLGFFGVAVQF